jgi:hypothetical protein
MMFILKMIINLYFNSFFSFVSIIRYFFNFDIFFDDIFKMKLKKIKMLFS